MEKIIIYLFYIIYIEFSYILMTLVDLNITNIIELKKYYFKKCLLNLIDKIKIK